MHACFCYGEDRKSQARQCQKVSAKKRFDEVSNELEVRFNILDFNDDKKLHRLT